MYKKLFILAFIFEVNIFKVIIFTFSFGPQIAQQINLFPQGGGDYESKLKETYYRLRNLAKMEKFIKKSDSAAEWSTRKDRAKFFLYPDHNNVYYNEEILTWNRASLEQSKYSPNFYPIFIIHGFLGNSTDENVQHIKNAYLHKGFFANVFLVDWSGVSQPNYNWVPNALGYPSAAFSVESIGKQIGEFIRFLKDYGALSDPTKVHLVGFSLGAHICGIAGESVLEWTGRPIGRITGLDPTGLDFYTRSLSSRLDIKDADFVDIIHTSNGIFGFSSSIGHVDFYPNGGGPTQPGCNFPIDFARDIPGLPGSCAHVVSYEYFVQSIYSLIKACRAESYKDFEKNNGAECTNPTYFGQFVSYSARGDYYLDIETD